RRTGTPREPGPGVLRPEGETAPGIPEAVSSPTLRTSVSIRSRQPQLTVALSTLLVGVPALLVVECEWAWMLIVPAGPLPLKVSVNPPWVWPPELLPPPPHSVACPVYCAVRSEEVRTAAP